MARVAGGSVVLFLQVDDRNVVAAFAPRTRPAGSFITTSVDHSDTAADLWRHPALLIGLGEPVFPSAVVPPRSAKDREASRSKGC